MDQIASAFLILWISSCLVLYFLGKGEPQNIMKFIGGFSVILIAVHARNGYVYFLSVVIAGLIIASERFMSVLVALLRSNSEIWKSDNFIKMIEKMSAEEIENKTREEVEEIESINKDEDVNKTTAEKENKSKRLTEYAKVVTEIERKALLKYQKILGFKIRKQVKIGKLLLDGVGINKKSNKIYFFEVKTIPDQKKRAREGDLVERIIKILKMTIPTMLLLLDQEVVYKTYPGYSSIVLTIIIVVDSDRNLDNIMEKVGTLKHIFNSSHQRVIVRFVFFNSNKL